MNKVYDGLKPLRQNVKFVKIDATNNKNLVNQYKIDGFPHILFFNNSDMVGSSSGYVEHDTLLTRLDESLGPNSSGLPISQNPTRNL